MVIAAVNNHITQGRAPMRGQRIDDEDDQEQQQFQGDQWPPGNGVQRSGMAICRVITETIANSTGSRFSGRTGTGAARVGDSGVSGITTQCARYIVRYLPDGATMCLVSHDGGADSGCESRHVGVWINVLVPVAYEFIVDPLNLPAWAAGVDTSQVTVEFSPRNAFGVLDHVVRTPTGETFYNPMRVIPAGGGQGRCEVVFTVRRRPGMTDDEFCADIAAVTADLQTLRRLLES
jgi:hypothetical protein